MSQFSFVIFPRKIENIEKESGMNFGKITYDEIKTIAKINFISEIYINKLLKETFRLLRVRPCDYDNKFSFLPDNFSQCVYELEGNFYEPETGADYNSDLIDLKAKFAVNYMYLVRRIQDMADRNQLYDLINENINSGEKVEVYSQWIHTDSPEIWGPPDNTYEISLEDVLSQKKFYSTTSSDDRFIIYKE